MCTYALFRYSASGINFKVSNSYLYKIKLSRLVFTTRISPCSCAAELSSVEL